MKKVISLLLALLMAFSVVTVAFATETDTTPETETETTYPIDLGEYQWILDLPFWTVGPALKFAKIAFKLVSAYLKVAKIFGIVDQDMSDIILDAVLGLIESSQNAEGDAEGDAETAPAALFA